MNHFAARLAPAGAEAFEMLLERPRASEEWRYVEIRLSRPPVLVA